MAEAVHLGRLTSLEHLVLDGNSADDAAMQHVASLPRLRRLSLRQSTISDAGLRHLAARRGSTLPPRAGGNGAGGAAAVPAGGVDAGEDAAQGGSPRAGSSGSDNGRDQGLVELDISGCTRLTDMCWLAITEVGCWAGGRAHSTALQACGGLQS